MFLLHFINEYVLHILKVYRHFSVLQVLEETSQLLLQLLMPLEIQVYSTNTPVTLLCMIYVHVCIISESEGANDMLPIVGITGGGVFLMTLLVGIGLVAVCIRRRRQKTSMFIKTITNTKSQKC